MRAILKSIFNNLENVRGGSPEKQRRGRLLARLIMITTALDIIFIIYNLWAWLFFGLGSDGFSFFLGLLGLPVLFGIFALNRSGLPNLAAILTLSLYFIRISVISNPDRFAVALWAFILPIMIASFVLRPIASFPAAGISALIYLLVSPAIGVVEKIDIIVFKLVLLAIFALISYLTASHLDWAIATLDRSEAKYRNLFNNLPVGLYRTSLDGKILDVNPAFLQMFGFPELQALQNIKAEELYADPSSRDQYLSLVEKTHSAEIMMRRLDGKMIWVNDHVSPVYDAAGKIVYFEGTLIDITERKRAEKELEQLAITDSLSGLSNRRHFFAQAESLFARLDKPDFELAVVMIDIDNFKIVNDQYGHATGDEVLHEVAYRIQSNLRPADILGRYGGEEFSIIVSRINLQEIEQIANRLCSAISDRAISVGDKDVSITISIGIATLDGPGTTLGVLLQHADQALYAAKHSGRNRWMLWRTGMTAR